MFGRYIILIIISIIALILIVMLYNKQQQSITAALLLEKLQVFITLTDVPGAGIDYIVISETPIPTPTPKPTQTPTPTKIIILSSDLELLFGKYSNQQSINRDLFRKIAICESNLNYMAVNGDYVGLFQFSSYYWKSIRRKMNLDDNLNLRYHPEESIKTAAFAIASYGHLAWPNCSK